MRDRRRHGRQARSEGCPQRQALPKFEYGPLTQSPKVDGTRIIQTVDVLFRIRQGRELTWIKRKTKPKFSDLA
jgi:hypothetical protein